MKFNSLRRKKSKKKLQKSHIFFFFCFALKLNRGQETSTTKKTKRGLVRNKMRLSFSFLVILSVVFCRLHRVNSYVVHPPNGGGKGPATTFIEETTPFQCTQVTIRTDDKENGNNDMDYKAALSKLLSNWKEPDSSKEEKGLAILFVSSEWSLNLLNIAQEAQKRIGGDASQTHLITIVGGGVIGDGTEEQVSASMSFMGGTLPEGSSVNIFHGTDGTTTKINNKSISAVQAGSCENHNGNRQSSHLVFADPHCSRLHDVLDKLAGDIVAGGISVGDKNVPSIAIGNKVLPSGSYVGASFEGNLGLQVVVSHGCRPVGPTYRVSDVKGAAVQKLNGESAFQQLLDTSHLACKEDQELFDKLGVLCGIHHLAHQRQQDGDNEENPRRRYTIDASKNGEDVATKYPEDFILREVTGFRPNSGSIMVCGPQIKEGDFLRFHVRSSETALQDWKSVLKRVRTERMFLGNQAGTPLGAIQISCMGRGKGLFGQEKTNVDLNHVQKLLNDDDNDEAVLPIAGLFANAEIGPVRLRMGTPGGVPDKIKKEPSYLHGYATVVALLCDYSKVDSSHSVVEFMMPELSCLGNSTIDISAWG